jgi:hypothetical protein
MPPQISASKKPGCFAGVSFIISSCCYSRPVHSPVCKLATPAPLSLLRMQIPHDARTEKKSADLCGAIILRRLRSVSQSFFRRLMRINFQSRHANFVDEL